MSDRHCARKLHAGSPSVQARRRARDRRGRFHLRAVRPELLRKSGVSIDEDITPIQTRRNWLIPRLS
jgi:hypothetical protein